jgi:abortive infection bacteriophage resistance protein
LSLFYKGLKNNRREGVEDKKAIADRFKVHHKKLTDWLHTLTYVRNVCAHHSRLWNRELAIRPDQNRDPVWSRPITPRNDRIFYILLILRHLLLSTGNGDEWAASVNELLAPVAATPKYRIAMGMPENWREHPIWK